MNLSWFGARDSDRAPSGSSSRQSSLSKLTGLHRTVAVAGIFCLCLSTISCPAKSQGIPTRRFSARELSIRRTLQKLDDSGTARYALAFRHLHVGGPPEAIVYLAGPSWCGTGGCRTLILADHGTSWQTITHITISRPPILVLPSTSHGWRSIAVWVQGGGAQPGYEAELRYDGKTYPSNPSMPPARRLKSATGDIAIRTLPSSGINSLTPLPRW